MYNPKVPRPVRYPSDATHLPPTKYPYTVNRLQSMPSRPDASPSTALHSWALPSTTHSVMDAAQRMRTIDISFQLSMTREEAKDMLEKHEHFVCTIPGDALVKALHSTSWSLKNTPESAFHFVFALMVQLHDAAIVGVPATRTGPCSLQLLAHDCDYDVKTGRLVPADRERSIAKPYLDERKVAAYQVGGEATATLIHVAAQVTPSLEPHPHGAAAPGPPVMVYHMPAATTGRTVQYLDAAAIGLDTFVWQTPKGAFVRAPQPQSPVCPDVLSYLICSQLGPQDTHALSKANHKVTKHPFQQWQYAHDTGTSFDPHKFTTQSLMETHNSNGESKTTTTSAHEEVALLMPVSTRQLDVAYERLHREVIQRTRGIWDCTRGLQLVFTPFDKARWVSYLKADTGTIEFTAHLELLYLPLTQWLGPAS
jgi:hypothetical protein